MKNNKLDELLLNPESPNKGFIIDLITNTKLENLIKLTERIDALSLNDPEDELYDIINAMMMMYFVSVQKMSDKGRIFRARKHTSNELFHDLSELTYPPAEYVKRNGRLNRANQSIYYAASNMQTAVAEVTYPEVREEPRGICTIVVSKTIDVGNQKLANLYPDYMDGKIDQATYELCNHVDQNITLQKPFFTEEQQQRLKHLRCYVSERIRSISNSRDYDCYKITSTIAKILFEGFAVNGVCYPSAIVGNKVPCVALLPATYDTCFEPLAAIRVIFEYPKYCGEDYVGNELMALHVTHTAKLEKGDSKINWQSHPQSKIASILFNDPKELNKPDKKQNTIVLPSLAIEEITKAIDEGSRKAQLADEAKKEAKSAQIKIELFQLEKAKEAANLVDLGQLGLARQKFIDAISDTKNLHVLNLAYEFFLKTRELESASGALDRMFFLSDPNKPLSDIGGGYSNLGNQYRSQGDLERAKVMYQKALDIFVSLDYKWGMAVVYDNYGNLYLNQGDTGHAAEMYQKALVIYESLGRKKGMASVFNNIGNIYLIQGDTDRAEEMYQKALDIHEGLGDKIGMALVYGNQGRLSKTRGDIDRTEELYQKSLAIYEASGQKKGMATQYGNLGNLYQIRGDQNKAEELYQKALDINEELDNKLDIANNHSNLGILFQARGDLNQAEEQYQKSLGFYEALSHKEGIARVYSSIGDIYYIREDFDQAEEKYQKALSSYEKLGQNENMALVYLKLGDIYHIRENLDQAKEKNQKALAIYESLGHSEGMAFVYGKLGDLYTIQGDLVRANVYLQKAAEISGTKTVQISPAHSNGSEK